MRALSATTASATAFDAAFAAALAERDEQGLLRRLRPLRRLPGGRVVTEDGRELVDLASNDYLGLSFHPALAEAAARAARDEGVGGAASRLIVGDSPACRELEARLAEHKGTEAALVLGSGFAANVGVVPALVGRGDAVFSDRLNHASIVDGCRLARADVHRYRHSDLDQLDDLLARSRAARKLIVTESVFSMDGDVAPLRELVELKQRHGAALLLDEAHGAGVFGPHGEGYAHELGVADGVDLHLGTFSKAFGVYGAYVAGRRLWIAELVNACRTLIYSTALPPPLIAAATAALELVRAARGERQRLAAHAARFRAELGRHGLDTGGSTTQIVPAIVGEPERALALARRLERRGVLAVGIRPPTVPAGTARVRFSLSAAHADEDVNRAIAAVAAATKEDRER